MDFEDATQCTQNTQGVVDPRRMGRNNSGLSIADIADVMCILHPCSPAAFKIVISTAEEKPHNVLQYNGLDEIEDGVTQSVLEEQETFILSSDAPYQAMDLALRFSTRTKNPRLGFVFGRHADTCDIVLAADAYKRISNMHFSIFVNDSGVLMLQDMSTNGTMVDETLLKGKGTAQGQQTRMLNPGSIIQILSSKPEDIVKFIVRIPSRDGHTEAYNARFQAYMQAMAATEAELKQNNFLTRRLAATAAHPRTQNGASIKAPLVQNQFGMHWNGGDRYNVVGLIGKGAFATVYQLATKDEGQLYAAKELEKRKFMKNGVLDRKLDNEMQIMKAVSHENIVKYIDYQDHINHMYIIMEFIPCGDLQQYLSLNGALPEDLAKKMAAQVLDALAYLHRKKITHRDIKPDNILIANMDADQFTVKLSDFGLSKVVPDNQTFLKTFCGTLLYCAPEVFPHYDEHMAGRGKKRTRKGTGHQPSKFHSYSQTVDIWSFGAVLWYSLCCKPPFEGVADGANGRGMFDKIMMTPLDVTDLVKQGISDDAVSLLVEMLNTDPAARPFPAYLLQNKWFGFRQQLFADAVAGARDDDLASIAEEDEVDGPNVSGLSLDEQESSHESQSSEVSIHSGSLEFLDPRKSKRFKSDAHSYREKDDVIESSPELLYQDIPIALQTGKAPKPVPASQPERPKLFGEISQSALESSTVLGRRASDAVERSCDRDEEQPTSSGSMERAQQAVSRGAFASPSLLGAESMVRELHMETADSPDSQDPLSSNPASPETPSAFETAFGKSANGVHGPDDDTTPKQPQRPVFNRQINIPIPASFYYDAGDPSTHTLEYASKISGHDYTKQANPAAAANPPSLPATTSGSVTDNDDAELREGNETAQNAEEQQQLSQASQFIKPPPRLGRLVSTEESFSPITINLSTKLTTWGRAPSNTHIHPDRFDTRMPKRGIIIHFHAKDIGKIPEDDQEWTKFPDLHCVLTTESSQGLYVNGVLLSKGEPGKKPFGRVYTGDEIVVVPRGPENKPGLKFICEFFHGEGKQTRPANVPNFVVEHEGSYRRSKGKEKENAAGVENGHISASI